MKLSRRGFFKVSGTMAAATVLGTTPMSSAKKGSASHDDDWACLVDTTLCVGFRYCMIACPFQIPAYEYDEPLMPRVMKCTFCYEYVKKGDLPACVASDD